MSEREQGGRPAYMLAKCPPSLTAHERRVREAMVLWGQSAPMQPTIPPLDERLCRARLILEEVFEFLEAAALVVSVTDDWRASVDAYNGDEAFSLEFQDLTFHCAEPVVAPDLPEMIDALADCSVVVTGSFVACGVASEPVLEVVDINNIEKAGRGHTNVHTGKFEKPANHVPPPIKTMLRLQGWSGN